MHPAYSVIIFTTASGAGYGLLIWLAVAAALNLVSRDPGLGFLLGGREPALPGRARLRAVPLTWLAAFR